MARLVQAGFELGDTQAYGAVLATGNHVNTLVTASPTPASGVYCDKCGINDDGNTLRGGVRKFVHTSATEMYYAFMLYSHTSAITAGPPGPVFFVAYDIGGLGNLMLSLDGGTIHAYGGTGTNGTTMPWPVVLIGTSSSSVTDNAWHLIEIHAIASTTTGGTIQVKLDGATVISATGVRTAQTNANYGSFGLMGAVAYGTNTGSQYFAFDDVRAQDTTGSVNNGWPGSEKIVLLTPNSAGDSTQWSRGGADSGTNYGQVDEIPPNGATDYVYDTVVGHLDLYNLTTQAVAVVSAIAVMFQAFNSDGGGGGINLVTKTPAGQSDGSAVVLTGAPVYFTRLLEADPADAGAWTQTKLTALQIGPKLAS